MKKSLALLFWLLAWTAQAQVFSGSASGVLATPGAGPSLLQIINAWQAQSSLVQVAGPPTNAFAASLALSAPAGGVIYMNGITNAITNNVIQDGFIKQVACYIAQCGVGQQIQFLDYRFDGATFNLISQSEVLNVPSSIGLWVPTLANPMAAAPGDQQAAWISGSATPANQCQLGAIAVPGTGNVLTNLGAVGSVTGPGAVDNYVLCLAAFMNPPFLATTGDSISVGHGYLALFGNGTGSAGDIGPTWATTNLGWQPGYQIRTNWFYGTANANTVRYQNLGQGGSTSVWLATNGMPAVAKANARFVFVHDLINDITHGLSWFNLYNDQGASNQLVNALRYCNTGQTVMFDAIFPTSLLPNNAATNAIIYAWCGYLKNFCALWRCVYNDSHDSMGNPADVAPGDEIQLLPAFSTGSDGLHPNPLGTSNDVFMVWQAATNGALNVHPIIPGPDPNQPIFNFLMDQAAAIHLGDTTSDYYAGQTNITFLTATNVAKVSFVLTKEGSGTISGNTYTAWILTMSGSSLNIAVPIAQSAGVVGDDSWAQTKIDFHFSPKVALSPSTSYAFVVSQNPVSSTAWVYMARTGNNNDIPGARFYYANQSGAATGGANSDGEIASSIIYWTP